MVNRRGVRGLLGPDPEQDVEHELSFHVEMRVEELVARGESRDRALRIAQERLGDYEAARRQCVAVDQAPRRRTTRTNYAGDVVQDGRYALRTLARPPGFAVAAVLSLAIGLTGTLSMVTLVDGVLLRPLPVRAEAELVVGWRGLPEGGARRWPFSAEDPRTPRAPTVGCWRAWRASGITIPRRCHWRTDVSYVRARGRRLAPRDE